ncbi:hypothetical protein IWQ48_002199 [Labrenzia sp. EL_13]|nr:hypothetical protein [Labrenzia sp. EL_13]
MTTAVRWIIPDCRDRQPLYVVKFSQNPFSPHFRRAMVTTIGG